MKMTLINEMKAKQNVLLIGPPGCAKTGRILAAALAAGFKVVIWRASLMERVDISGCIVPNHEKGISAQLPFADIAYLRTTKDLVLLFIDDLGQAPLDVQAAIMRCFDNNYFPPNVVIWAASNRPGDKAGVNSLCEPLRSRFDSAYVIATPGTEDKPAGGVLLQDWQTELSEWIEWAFDNNAPAEIIAYHRTTKGKALYNWQPSADPSLRMADYRSWGALIRRWNSGLRDLNSCAAVIGKPEAATFLAYAALADKLPCPDEVWLNPLGAPVPCEPSAQWLIITSLAGQVSASTCPAFLKYISRFNPVMAALGGKDAFRRLGAKLSGCRDWNNWFTANSALFDTN